MEECAGCGLFHLSLCNFELLLQAEPWIHLTDLISQLQSVQTTDDDIIKWIDVSCHVMGHVTFHVIT